MNPEIWNAPSVPVWATVLIYFVVILIVALVVFTIRDIARKYIGKKEDF